MSHPKLINIQPGDLIIVHATYLSSAPGLNVPVIYLSQLGMNSLYVIYKNDVKLITLLDDDVVAILSTVRE